MSENAGDLSASCSRPDGSQGPKSRLAQLTCSCYRSCRSSRRHHTGASGPESASGELQGGCDPNQPQQSFQTTLSQATRKQLPLPFSQTQRSLYQLPRTAALSQGWLSDVICLLTGGERGRSRGCLQRRISKRQWNTKPLELLTRQMLSNHSENAGFLLLLSSKMPSSRNSTPHLPAQP